MVRKERKVSLRFVDDDVLWDESAGLGANASAATSAASPVSDSHTYPFRKSDGDQRWSVGDPHLELYRCGSVHGEWCVEWIKISFGE